MRAVGMLFLALGVAAGARGSAQIVPPLDSAARVRVTAPARGLTAQVATVVAQRADTLWLDTRPQRDTVTLTARELGRLEVSRGKHGHALRGMALGFAAGAALGAILASASPSNKEDCYYCGDQGFDAAAGAVFGGMTGAVVGAIVGANHKTEQWRLVIAAPAPVSAASLGSVGLRLGFRRGF